MAGPASGVRAAGARRPRPARRLVSARTVKFFADGVIEAGTAAHAGAVRPTAPHTLRAAGLGAATSWPRRPPRSTPTGSGCTSTPSATPACAAPWTRSSTSSGSTARATGVRSSRTRSWSTPPTSRGSPQLGVIANVEPLWAQLDPLQVDLTLPRLGAAAVAPGSTRSASLRRDRRRALDGQRLAGQLPPPARRAGRRRHPADPRTASPGGGWLPHERLPRRRRRCRPTPRAAPTSRSRKTSGACSASARGPTWSGSRATRSRRPRWTGRRSRCAGPGLPGSGRPVPLRDRCRRLSRVGPLISW